MISPHAIIQGAVSLCMFLVVWRLLDTKLFRPFLSVLEQREARTVGDEQEAARIREETREILAGLEQTIGEARLRGMRRRDEMTAAAKESAARIVGDAQSAAHAKIEKARGEISVMRQRSRQELAREIDGLSSLVVEKVLASGNQPTVH